MNRARRRIPLGTSAARRLQQLSARTSRQRQGQFRAELEERRQFEDLGLDNEAVQRARAAAYLEAMAGVMEERREPYQLEIPGIKATLMSLRSREPMTDDEARAMGIVLPIEPPARGPEGEQMEMNFDAPTAANQITLLPRQVTGESVSDRIDQLARLKEHNSDAVDLKRMAGAREFLAAAGRQYRDNAVVQDALETLIGSAVVAGGQAVFTDMSPEEIALSTLLGGAAAFGARPIAAGIGGGIGKRIDQQNPNILKNVDFGLASQIPGTPASVMLAERARRETTGKTQEAAKLGRDLMLSKYRQNFKGRGDMEGLLTAIGRYSGDNIAQAAVGLTVPMFLGGEEEEVPAVLTQ